MKSPASSPQHRSATIREEIESWRKVWETDQAEITRNDKVQGQFEAVRQSLQQKCNDLDLEVSKLSAHAMEDDAVEALKLEVQTATAACEALEAQCSELTAEKTTTDWLREEFMERATAGLKASAEEAAAARAHKEACELAEVRCEEARTKARSMVMAELLDRATEEALKLQNQLIEHEAEACRLRQALADSWAARSDDPVAGGSDGGAGGKAGAELQELDDVEEKLQWLASAQQQAAAEVHHLQHLERSEAALQAKLRALSEEKASLQSARVDLGDAGKAMREAVAVQSEGYVRRVGALEEERSGMEKDRKKLLQECADMQARLDAITPELTDLAEVEDRHREFQAEHSRLTDESQRLRDINGALGAQLMADHGSSVVSDGEAAVMAEELKRVVQLLRRFAERTEAHDLEKQKLADRIRMMEREAAQGGSSATPAREVPPARGAAKAAPARPQGLLGNPLASATSVLRGGLGRLRDAALDQL